MKITRQDSNESYNTTVDWIKDFAKNLESSNIRQADHLDNIRRMVNKKKDFATIEEKMADIKSRVGFTIIKETSNDNINVKSASSCGCDDGAESCSCDVPCNCGGTCDACSAAKKYGSEIILLLRTILEYVRDFAKDRPEIGADAMIAHVREQPKLNFHTIHDKIDPVKFKNTVSKLLSKHQNKKDVVKYNPEESMIDAHSASDIADYVSHANTGTQ